MMNRYNETGTIINFSARTYMNHKCICTYASDDEKFHAIIYPIHCWPSDVMPLATQD